MKYCGKMLSARERERDTFVNFVNIYERLFVINPSEHFIIIIIYSATSAMQCVACKIMKEGNIVSPTF